MRLRRGEALAAVALAVGAREEPVAVLRRLAAEDSDLRVLTRVADQCAAGASLGDALAFSGLLSQRRAQALAALSPPALAAEIGRLAQHAVAPPAAIALARWWPVCAVAAASVPSLLIGGIVAVVAGSGYTSVWSALGVAPPHSAPAWGWLAQTAGIAIAAAIAGGCWAGLRRVPFLRQVTILSSPLARAEAVEAVLHDVRSGAAVIPAWRRWARESGHRPAVDWVLEHSGGDAVGALIALGALPRGTDGRADWEEGLREARWAQRRALERAAPGWCAVLVVVGLAGFFTWGTRGLAPLFGLEGWVSDAARFLPGPMVAWHQAVDALVLAVGAVALAHLLRLARSVLGLLAGPRGDWPLVADRCARAIERGDDLGLTLRGLETLVGASMRRRLRRAAGLDEPHPGRRLVRGGVVPRAAAPAIAGAMGSDLPALLHAAGERVEDHGLGQVAGTAALLGLLVLPIALLQMGWARTFASMARQIDDPLIDLLQGVAIGSAAAVAGAVVLVAIATALGSRFSWWDRLDGTPRLLRGLALRRLLASRADEATCAAALTPLAMRMAPALAAAGARGDVAGLCAAIGWRVADPAALDRALRDTLISRDRRRARMALAARLLLPLLLAVPIAANAGAITWTLVRYQTHIRDRLDGGSAASFSGGMAGMALVHWWTQRCEAEGEAAVEAIRARQEKP